MRGKLPTFLAVVAVVVLVFLWAANATQPPYIVTKDNQESRGLYKGIAVNVRARKGYASKITIRLAPLKGERWLSATFRLVENNRYLASVPMKMTKKKDGFTEVVLTVDPKMRTECSVDLCKWSEKEGLPERDTYYQVQLATYLK